MSILAKVTDALDGIVSRLEDYMDKTEGSPLVDPEPTLLLSAKELKLALTKELRELVKYRADICNPISPKFTAISRDAWEELNCHIYRVQTIVDTPALLRVITRAANARHAE